MTAIAIALAGFITLYALWVFYLAGMSLKRAKDAGLLTRTAKSFGYPVLFAGLALDFLAAELSIKALTMPSDVRSFEWATDLSLVPPLETL